MPYDPVTGDWYDDEEGFSSYLMPGSTNQWLPQGGVGTALFPGDYNKYGEQEPYEMADVNQQFTGIKSLLAILSNPMFNQLVAGQTGADTYDYGALAGVDPYTGMPGGGGAGGGGGGGGGYQSVYTTPWSDAAAQSADPVEEGIYKSIRAGQTPTAVLNGLAQTVGPDELERYGATANAIFNEQAGFQRNAMQPGGQTALQQWSAKTGQPNPGEVYSPDALPTDIEDWTSAALNPRMRELAKLARGVDKEADATGINLNATPVRGMASSVRGALGLSEPEPKNRFLAGLLDRSGAVDRQVREAVKPSGGMPLATARTADDIRRVSGLLSPEETAAIEEPIRQGVGAGGAGGGSGSWGRGRGDNAPGPVWDIFGRGQGVASVQARDRQAAQTRQPTVDLRKRAERIRNNAASTEVGVRQLAANTLARQGRTPLRDRQSAQLNFLRQLGIGI